MSGMEGLGREFNIIPAATGSVYTNVLYASGVTFVCNGANAETFTVAEAKDASGTGAQTLAVIDHYYTNASAAGANAWAYATQAAGGVVTTTTAVPVAAFFINPVQMSAGYKYLRVTPSASGKIVVVTHDLTTKRAPNRLPALGV